MAAELAEAWRIVLVNVGEDPATAKEYAGKVGWGGEMILDTEGLLATLFAIRCYSTTVFLSPGNRPILAFQKGVLTAQVICGITWDDPLIIGAFKDAARDAQLKQQDAT